MLQQWVHYHYSRRWCVNDVRLEVCYLPIDTRAQSQWQGKWLIPGKRKTVKEKKKKNPGQTVRITSDAHWWSWIQQKSSITTWTPIQQKSRIDASPPWTDHLCTIKFCRHTYICSDNQDLQTQLPKSNQNSDGKPFGNIPSEPVAGRVTNKRFHLRRAIILYTFLHSPIPKHSSIWFFEATSKFAHLKPLTSSPSSRKYRMKFW